MARILVADDDAGMREALETLLCRAGHEATTVGDGAQALEAFGRGGWDVVVLDVVMPVMDGFEALEAIRRVDETMPVLMLSSKGDIVDKKGGFRGGADDYVVKPFDPDELLLRVGALVRRGKLTCGAASTAAPGADGAAVEAMRVLHVGDLAVDFSRYEVSIAGKTVALTPKEFQLVACMAQDPGRVFTTEELISDVWGQEYTGEAISIPVYIRRIRMKLEPDPSSPVYIKTVWRFGYQLCPGNSRA